MRFEDKKCLVTGGLGFIGSHLVDQLIKEGADVIVIDNGLSGSTDNLNINAKLFSGDITNFDAIRPVFDGIEYVFHMAAIARTPWCIENPFLCYQTNVFGTLAVLEASRQTGVKRVVLSSSNVVYAFMTPYRTSKEAVEALGKTYVAMYGQSVVSLRYSNVYGKRQSEEGPSPNVFAALRKSKKENGYLTITGDGEQSRDYTHVSDIVGGNILAVFSDYCGVVDLCTGINTSLNEVSSYFSCPVKYIDERPGDVKHIFQNPQEANTVFGFKAKVSLSTGISDVL